MNQLQAYKRIVILSIIAAVGVWQTNLVLTGFCFAIDQNQNTATTGDSASEILLVDSKAETQNGVANKIIFSSKNIWETRALPYLTKIGDWISNFWETRAKPAISNTMDYAGNKWEQNAKPFIQNIINKIKDLFDGNKSIIEEKKANIGIELEKEEMEIQQESPYLYMAIEKYRQIKQYIWGSSSYNHNNEENSK